MGYSCFGTRHQATFFYLYILLHQLWCRDVGYISSFFTAVIIIRYENCAIHPKTSQTRLHFQTLENWISVVECITTNVLGVTDQFISHDIKITLHWIPGHMVIWSNEHADRLAGNWHHTTASHHHKNKTTDHIHSSYKQQCMDAGPVTWHARKITVYSYTLSNHTHTTHTQRLTTDCLTPPVGHLWTEYSF